MMQQRDLCYITIAASEILPEWLLQQKPVLTSKVTYGGSWCLVLTVELQVKQHSAIPSPNLATLVCDIRDTVSRQCQISGNASQIQPLLRQDMVPLI